MTSQVSYFRSLFRRPEIRLALLAWTTGVFVQSGAMNGDTMRRVHVAHALWTIGEPTISLTDTGIVLERPGQSSLVHALVGRGGKLYAWNGVGQSLVLLPADMIATGVTRALGLQGEKASMFRYLLIAYLTFPLLTGLTLFFAFRLLKELEVSSDRAVLGCLGLLFASTFLPYSQNQEENSLLIALVVSGIYVLLRWLKTARLPQLVIGTACFGGNVLVRITTLCDAFFLSLFVLELLAIRTRQSGEISIARRKAARFIGVSTLVYAVSGAIDRVYHFIRFESWTGNYHEVYARQWGRQLGLPASWPWNGPFWDGFLGPLFWPSKSVFLFDPLLVVLVLLVVGSWARVRLILRLWLASLVGMFVTYLVFYARHAFWGADPAWACRYHLTPVWLMCLVTLPVLAEAWDSLGRLRRVIATVVIGWAVAVQLAALVFPYYLEEDQRKTQRLYVVGRRFVNIVAVATGRAHELGLDNGNPAEFEKGLTPNILPLRLARRELPSLAVLAGPFVIVFGLLEALQLVWLIQSLRRGKFSDEGRPTAERLTPAFM